MVAPLVQYVPLFAPGQIELLAVGGIVAVRVRVEPFGTFVHKGIVTDELGADGYPMIIHRSKHFGKVALTSATDFAFGRVDSIRFDGFYERSLPAAQILERARLKMGEPWGLWSNCEHFVSYAQGIEPVSPQLQEGVAKTALGVGLGIVVVGFLSSLGDNNSDDED